MHPNGFVRESERGSGLVLCVCFLGMALSLGMSAGTVVYIAAKVSLSKEQAALEAESERLRLETAKWQAQTLREIRELKNADYGAEQEPTDTGRD